VLKDAAYCSIPVPVPGPELPVREAREPVEAEASRGIVRPARHSGSSHARPLTVLSPVRVRLAAHPAAIAGGLQLFPLVDRQLVRMASRKRAFARSRSPRACTTLSIWATMAASFGWSALISGSIANSAFSRLAADRSASPDARA